MKNKTFDITIQQALEGHVRIEAENKYDAYEKADRHFNREGNMLPDMDDICSLKFLVDGEALDKPEPLTVKLPNGDVLRIDINSGDVNREEGVGQVWESVDISLVHCDGARDLLCSVDYEDDIGLRSLVYAAGKDDPVFIQEHNYDEMPHRITYYKDTVIAQIYELLDGGYIKERHLKALLDRIEPITRHCLIDCDTWEALHKEDLPLSHEMNIVHEVIFDEVKRLSKKKTLSAQIKSAEDKTAGSAGKNDKEPDLDL